MAGLYFHIPWCRKVCAYCNFHFSTNLRGVDSLLTAMELELERESAFLQGQALESVYLGGGTPSLLQPEQIDRLLRISAQLHHILPEAEITLEANPEDIVPDKLKGWKAAGVNRLSIGIQSLLAEDLQYMNRNHDAAQAVECVQLALDAGFPSLNIDLIFGSPWLPDEAWEQHLNWAFSCGADHISAYALTVEPKTFLNKKVQKGEWPGVNQDRQSQQYRMLAAAAEMNGWDFYEISNLSKPGHRALHNSNYWNNKPYLGIGPSAHSFCNHTRRWNVADNRGYTNGILSGESVSESETLSLKDRYNEYLLTNIRTTEGVDMKTLADFGLISISQIRQDLQSMADRDLLLLSEDRATLTLEGRLLADWITSELMG